MFVVGLVINDILNPIVDLASGYVTMTAVCELLALIKAFGTSPYPFANTILTKSPAIGLVPVVMLIVPLTSSPVIEAFALVPAALRIVMVGVEPELIR